MSDTFHTPEASEPIKLGYVRLSREDKASLSVEGQVADLLKIGVHRDNIFIDNHLSGRVNLVEPEREWAKLRERFDALVREGEKPRVCMVADDRLGRKFGKVMSAMEDITDVGGSLYFIADDTLHTDSTDFTQTLIAAHKAMKNQEYQVGTVTKTARSLKTLKDAGVKLGPKPKLTDSQVAWVLAEYNVKGHGYSLIARDLGVSRTTIKTVVKGCYLSREQWERHNADARAKRGLPQKTPTV